VAPADLQRSDSARWKNSHGRNAVIPRPAAHLRAGTVGRAGRSGHVRRDSRGRSRDRGRQALGLAGAAERPLHRTHASRPGPKALRRRGSPLAAASSRARHLGAGPFRAHAWRAPKTDRGVQRAAHREGLSRSRSRRRTYGRDDHRSADRAHRLRPDRQAVCGVEWRRCGGEHLPPAARRPRAQDFSGRSAHHNRPPSSDPHPHGGDRPSAGRRPPLHFGGRAGSAAPGRACAGSDCPATLADGPNRGDCCNRRTASVQGPP
jgi:hypothetical protein